MARIERIVVELHREERGIQQTLLDVRVPVRLCRYLLHHHIVDALAESEYRRPACDAGNVVLEDNFVDVLRDVLAIERVVMNREARRRVRGFVQDLRHLPDALARDVDLEGAGGDLNAEDGRVEENLVGDRARVEVERGILDSDDIPGVRVIPCHEQARCFRTALRGV